MIFIEYLFIFCFGACIGSFLNVCIYRPAAGKSIVRPGSHCFSCEHPLAWYDNIPIFSYISLKGQCRYCKAKFSPRYAVVEALTGIMFAILLWEYSWSFELLIYAIITAGLIVATFVDFDHFIIPNFITFPGMIFGLIWSFVVWLFFKESAFLVQNPMEAILGFAVGAGFLFSIGEIFTRVLKKEAMGFGDVKLLGMLGLFIGWKLVLLTVILSSFVGSIVGVLMISMKKQKNEQGHIPFGPYLALAAYIAMVWGTKIIEWYISLLQTDSYNGY